MTDAILIDALTLAELEELKSYEAVIDAGLTTYFEVGSALQQIRDNRLYRADYPTYEAYCQSRWGFTERHADRLTSASEVRENLRPIGLILPTNEAQARPMTGLPAEQQREAWTQAVASASDGKPTAATVEAEVKKVKKHFYVGQRVAYGGRFFQIATLFEGRALLRSLGSSETLDDISADDLYETLTESIAARIAKNHAQGVPETQTDDEPEPTQDAQSSPPVGVETAITENNVPQGRQKPKSNVKGEHAEDEPDPRDACQTPDYAIDPLLPFLKQEWTIWEPAYGEGLLVDALFDGGLEGIITSDLLNGQDFFKYQPDYDVIVTNPPFSTKYDWLARCYALGKPFALLMPIDTLGSKAAQALFKKHGVEIIFMSDRVDFKMPEKAWRGGGAQFSSAWFTWQMNLGQENTFADIEAAKVAFKQELREAGEID